MKPTRGDYDIHSVKNVEPLKEAIVEINNADGPEARAERLAELLMNGHEGSTGYLTFGNNKLSKSIGIFNMNSATDCPNAATAESDDTLPEEEKESETGTCQVEFGECYAQRAEEMYNNPLPKRRRQELLWDHMDAKTFADALLRVKERKRSPFTDLRFSEAGDFRNDMDIYKVEEIARRLDGMINVYTYSASHKLVDAWNKVEHLTVNQSNNFADYGDRLFTALPEGADLPEGMVWCAYDISDGEKKCGDCRICLEKGGPDVAVEIHL